MTLQALDQPKASVFHNSTTHLVLGPGACGAACASPEGYTMRSRAAAAPDACGLDESYLPTVHQQQGQHPPAALRERVRRLKSLAIAMLRTAAACKQEKGPGESRPPRLRVMMASTSAYLKCRPHSGAPQAGGPFSRLSGMSWRRGSARRAATARQNAQISVGQQPRKSCWHSPCAVVPNLKPRLGSSKGLLEA